MNIAKLLNINTPNINYNNNNQTNIRQTNFGLKMSAPLSCDTVSFGATKKNITNEDKKSGVNLKTAREVHDVADEMQPKVRDFANKTWGKYLVTQMNPQNPILKICDRCKSPLSIKEKSQGRHFESSKEILEKMTDLNGMKLVMRDASKPTIDKMLLKLVEPIKKGEIELIEIENKRPACTKKDKGAKGRRFDYASPEVLFELADIQNKKNDTKAKTKGKEVRVDLDDFTEVNYSAIHMLLKLKGEKRPFEFTIMGADVSQLKDLDDKLFKILNGKDIDDKYAPIKKLVKPLTEDGNQDSLEKFNKYRGDAMIFQRMRAPSSYSLQNKNIHFLPMMEDLDPKLDLNELYKLMQRCDAKANSQENNTTTKE